MEFAAAVDLQVARIVDALEVGSQLVLHYIIQRLHSCYYAAALLAIYQAQGISLNIHYYPYLTPSDRTCISMIGNSLVDYIGIRLSITLLRLIAPTSIVYLVLSFFHPKYFVIPIGVVAVAEASFYLLVYLPRRRCLQAVRFFSLTLSIRIMHTSCSFINLTASIIYSTIIE